MTPTDTAFTAITHEWSRLILDPASRTWWGYLLAAALIAWGLARLGPVAASSWRERAQRWFGASARVDYALIFLKPFFFAFISLPWILSAHGLAVHGVRTLDAWWGMPTAPELGTWQIAALYSLVLFVAWDLSRYLLHLAMHRVEALWQFHQVHHSADTLSPFTLYRVHPVESALYRARGVLVTALVTTLFFWVFRTRAVELQLLGVNALGFVCSAIGGNLRHSHTWWSWGPRVERWLISPAQHQLHHASAPEASQVNYGTWLSVWDRLGGSLHFGDGEAPAAFGLEPVHRNHDPHRVFSVLVDPMLACLRTLAPTRLPRLLGLGGAAAALLVPQAAHGQAPVEAPELARPPEAPGPVDLEPSAPAPKAEAAPEDAAPEQAAPEDAAPEDAAPVPEPEPEPEPEAEGEDEDDGYTRKVTVLGEVEDLPRVVGSAHVIDEEALERGENDDIGRELATVPGVYVRGEDGFGLRPNIGLRGVDPNRSSKVTLMEDGVLLGPAPYAAPAAYFFPLPTRMTGIEVFKGPAAVRHGPNTIGGAVNVLTREIPWSNDGGIDLAIGQRGYGKAHGFWGRSWDHFGILVEGARLGSDGFKELDGGGETGFSKNEGMLKMRANGDPAARVYQQVDLKVGVATERSYETYLGITQADFEATPYRRYAASQRGRMTWWRTQAELAYSLSFNDLIEFQATAYRHDFSRDWRKFNRFAGGPSIYDIMADTGSGQAAIYLGILKGEEDSSDPDQTLRIGTNGRTYVSQGVQNTLRISPRSRYVDQNIELGVRFHNDTVRREHIEDGFLMVSGSLVSDGSDTVTTTLNRGTAYAGAIHLHDEIRIVDRFTVSPGARVELIRTEFRDFNVEANPSAFNAVFVPGIGAHVKATEWLGVLGGVHSGFSPVAPGQPDDVKPERSINYEAGFRLGGEPLRGFTSEAIGFWNDYSNLTGECTFAQGCDDTNIGDQFNAGEVRVAGGEFGAGFMKAFDNTGWFEANANYTFTWSQFQGTFSSASPQFGNVEAGDALPYLPMHVSSLKVAGGMQRFSLWGTLAYNGEMRDSPGQGEIEELDRIPHFLTLDMGARVWITDAASVYLNVANVTGAKYIVSRRPFGVLPGRPRFGVIGFKYDFGL